MIPASSPRSSPPVQSDPENVNLRLHLAGMLLEAGQANDALDHYAQVLNKQPAHLEALQSAARAAEITGDADRAAGYKRLHEALSWNRSKSLIDDIEETRLSDTAKPKPQQNYKSNLRQEDEDEEDDEDESPTRLRATNRTDDDDDEEG